MISRIKRLIYSDEQGMISLNEVLIAASLLGIIIGVSYGLLIFGFRVESDVSVKSELQKQVQATLYTMTSDLRAAKSIENAQANRLVYIDAQNNKRCYYLNGTTLRKANNNTYTGGTALLENVSSLSFTYARKDGTSAANASQIGVVFVTISATRTSGKPITLTISDRIKLRNYDL